MLYSYLLPNHVYVSLYKNSVFNSDMICLHQLCSARLVEQSTSSLIYANQQ